MGRPVDIMGFIISTIIITNVTFVWNGNLELFDSNEILFV